jgi:hypothetical protein
MIMERDALAASHETSYRIDAEDCITAVSEGWIEFAKENGGRLLLPPEIIGTVLWDWITDAQTRHVYRTLLQRVRASSSVMRFQFRCDSPAERRLLQMKIVPEANGAVTFRTEVVSKHSRNAVELLDTTFARSRSLLKICGWCMRVENENSWLEIEDAIPVLRLFEAPRLPNLTHGMCPACYDVMIASFDGPAETVPPA